MTPEHVVPGVYRLPFDVGQAYVVEQPHGLVLIDTGAPGSGPAITGSLHALGLAADDLVEIVITHSHDDHRGSLAELLARTSAASIAHTADAPIIRGVQDQVPPNLTAEERPFAEAVAGPVPPAPAAPVTREAADGDAIGGGRVIHVPGHTPGSIAVLFPALGVLFTGDTVASVNGSPILGPFNIDRQLARASVKRLAAFDFEVACFGHGAPLIGGAAEAIRRLSEGW